jgi:hypothetical protein
VNKKYEVKSNKKENDATKSHNKHEMSEVTGAEYGILIYSKHFLGRGR